jgi:hypothetical protein
VKKEPKKDVFFTEKINRVFGDIRTFAKSDRLQYRIDAKALMCRGIKDDEVKQIQRGLYVEDGMFYLSRLYVPWGLFRMYRSGIFQDTFSFMEIRYVIRIIIAMQCLDLAGHAALRYMTRPIVDKYVGENENEYAFKKKKIMDDYII